MISTLRTPERIAVVGAGGRLGAALVREYGKTLEVRAFTRAELDLAQPEAIRAALERVECDLVINCAAQTNVDRCEREPVKAFALNAEAPGTLAEICAAKRARLLHISTDYVFAGDKAKPYDEEDDARPVSVYGESKRKGEEAVLAVSSRHLVVRVSWVFGPDRPSFIDWVIEQARTKEKVAAIADKFSTPSYTLDLAEMLRRLWTADPDGGIFHLTNGGQCSWREYGQWALECCRAESVPLQARRVDATTLAEMKQFIARRPVHSILATGKYERATGDTPRPWQEAVRDYVRSHVAAVTDQQDR